MHGSPLTKCVRLAADLASHPGNLGRYLRDSFPRRRAPLDVMLPWTSYAAIDYLDRALRPEMTVFEYGSGGSTLFFAQRVRRVVCVEDDADWLAAVQAKLDELQLDNCELYHAPFDPRDVDGFEQTAYFNQLRSVDADLYLIDGQELWPDYIVRPACFRLAESRVKPGGLIVLDDSWRYPDVRRDNKARQHRVLQSAGPGRLGVTSTDAFEY